MLIFEIVNLYLKNALFNTVFNEIFLYTAFRLYVIF